MTSILVTGAAGFIGSFTATALLNQGHTVIGVDNLNPYYNPLLKKARLARLENQPGFTFLDLNIADKDQLQAALEAYRFDRIIHLAAQAGVRYSLEAPFSYIDANVTGHLAMLELARTRDISHMVYASSSSVYGRNTKTPFHENDMTDQPASLYGATKKADELLASSYAHLYHLPLTGLRFFTVYGPWGRPDMAYWIFTEKMLAGEPIDIFNHGRMARDFTYVDDVVDGILGALLLPPTAQHAFHKVYNLGNDQPQPLMGMIGHLETSLGITADKRMLDMQKGDVEKTWADISRARDDFGYQPKISLQEGIERFVDWRQSLPTPF